MGNLFSSRKSLEITSDGKGKKKKQKESKNELAQSATITSNTTATNISDTSASQTSDTAASIASNALNAPIADGETAHESNEVSTAVKDDHLARTSALSSNSGSDVRPASNRVSDLKFDEVGTNKFFQEVMTSVVELHNEDDGAKPDGGEDSKAVKNTLSDEVSAMSKEENAENGEGEEVQQPDDQAQMTEMEKSPSNTVEKSEVTENSKDTVISEVSCVTKEISLSVLNEKDITSGDNNKEIQNDVVVENSGKETDDTQELAESENSVVENEYQRTDTSANETQISEQVDIHKKEEIQEFKTEENKSESVKSEEICQDSAKGEVTRAEDLSAEECESAGREIPRNSTDDKEATYGDSDKTIEPISNAPTDQEEDKGTNGSVRGPSGSENAVTTNVNVNDNVNEIANNSNSDTMNTGDSSADDVCVSKLDIVLDVQSASKVTSVESESDEKRTPRLDEMVEEVRRSFLYLDQLDDLDPDDNDLETNNSDKPNDRDNMADLNNIQNPEGTKLKNLSNEKGDDSVARDGVSL